MQLHVVNAGKKGFPFFFLLTGQQIISPDFLFLENDDERNRTNSEKR
jgi:hypothetical protein